jgi:hypothetical protein
MSVGTRRWLRAGTAAFAGAVVLTACGGTTRGSSSGATASGGSPSASANPQAALKEGLSIAFLPKNDDDQKSFTETQGLLRSYPDLKGIISPTTVGIAAAARYLSSSQYKGKVALTGLGTPNPEAVVRQGRHGQGIRAVEPGRPRLPGRLCRRGARVRADHREGRRDVQGGQARPADDREGPRRRAGPADRVHRAEHRPVPLLRTRHGGSGAAMAASPVAARREAAMAPSLTGGRPDLWRVMLGEVCNLDARLAEAGLNGATDD